MDQLFGRACLRKAASILRPSGGAGAPRSLPKAAEIFARDLRGEILGRGLRPGSAIPSEPELIDRSGFSRASVREGLRLLEAEGLIAIRRGRNGGIEVRHPDFTQVLKSFTLLLAVNETSLRRVMDFRKLLEPVAARVAANEATSEQRQSLVSMARASRADSIGVQDHVAFHVELSLATGDDFMQMILAVLYELVELHAPGERLTQEDWQHTVEAHTRIAEAIAEGDADTASRLMRKHVDGFESVLERIGRLDGPIVPRNHWTSVSSNRSGLLG